MLRRHFLTASLALAATSVLPVRAAELFSDYDEISTYTPAKGEEVGEFFSYACPHCYAHEPKLQAWLKTNKVRGFVRHALAMSQEQLGLARAYYVFEMKKRPDLHWALFQAIHKTKEVTSGATLTAWLKTKLGDDAPKLLNDPQVVAKTIAAYQAFDKTGLDGVPVVVVGGKYTTSPGIAGDRFYEVLTDLLKLSRKDQKRVKA
jgi:protein dithiol oxidoreductase (disulfide-forming)